ncbi:Kinase, NEK [Giardia muris]|uniref:Kinase, NEK n=1 Tax=Giardia muris TaxID=5742 RepID=A0A4Z1SX61_GIAMU|nr:Kinase, NEK [Giardia muris]|eukprot:TNJ28118.1 Kinase, NEK [Giardia muris]
MTAPYTARSVVGETGYSCVYEVQDPVGKGLLAHKTVSYKGLPYISPDDISQILTACTYIENDHVVQIKRAIAEETRKMYHVVMELSDGNLNSLVAAYRVREAIVPERVVCDVLAQLVLGILYLHTPDNKDFKDNDSQIYSLGAVVHRAIQPANVLVDTSGAIRLGDLPLTEDLFQTQLHLNIRAKGPYCAPELLSDDDEYDEKVDVWSLGAVLYYLCTLTPLTSGSDAATIRNNVLKLSPKDKAIPRIYPEPLRSLVVDLLDPNPLTRPSIFEVSSHPFVKTAIEVLNFQGPQPLELYSEERRPIPPMAMIEDNSSLINEVSQKGPSDHYTDFREVKDIVELDEDHPDLKPSSVMNDSQPTGLDTPPREQQYEGAFNSSETFLQTPHGEGSTTTGGVAVDNTPGRSPPPPGSPSNELPGMTVSTLWFASPYRRNTEDPLVKEVHNTPLIMAALQGDVTEVGANIEYARQKNVFGKTALMYAAEKNYVEVVQLLIPFESGLKDNNGITALHTALFNNSLLAANALLEAEGTKPITPTTDQLGVTDLMRAAQCGDIITAYCLIPYQGNKFDYQGKTALIYALENDHPEVARVLAAREGGTSYKKGMLSALHLCAIKNYPHVARILAGREAGLRTPNGKTALHIATEKMHHDVVQALAPTEGGILDADGFSALFIAIGNDDAKGVEILASYERELLSPDGRTALEVAVERGNYQIASIISPEVHSALEEDTRREIFSTGAQMRALPNIDTMQMSDVTVDASFTNALQRAKASPAGLSYPDILNYAKASATYEHSANQDFSPLTSAVLNGDFVAAAALAKIDGPNPDAFERRGMRHTELMQMAEEGQIGRTWCLLSQAGLADVDGTTALMLAAKNGHLECCKLLLDAEAGMRRPDGVCALTFAIVSQNIEICRLLDPYEGVKNVGPPTYGFCRTPLIEAIISDDLCGIWTYSATQAGLHDEYGKTALMYAAERGNVFAIKILLEYELGMQMLSDWRGGTALMYASRSGQLQACQLLIDEARMQDSYGMTALMLAAEKNYVDIVELLIQYEAGIRMFNSRTACMRAAELFNIEALQILLPTEGIIPHHTGKTCLDLANESPAQKSVGSERKLACLALLRSFYRDNAVLQPEPLMTTVSEDLRTQLCPLPEGQSIDAEGTARGKSRARSRTKTKVKSDTGKNDVPGGPSEATHKARRGSSTTRTPRARRRVLRE